MAFLNQFFCAWSHVTEDMHIVMYVPHYSLMMVQIKSLITTGQADQLICTKEKKIARMYK